MYPIADANGYEKVIENKQGAIYVSVEEQPLLHNEQFKCLQCNKVFPESSLLYAHSLVHAFCDSAAAAKPKTKKKGNN